MEGAGPLFGVRGCLGGVGGFKIFSFFNLVFRGVCDSIGLASFFLFCGGVLAKRVALKRGWLVRDRGLARFFCFLGVEGSTTGFMADLVCFVAGVMGWLRGC